jgi:transcriptional repressor NF-X1
VCCPLSFQAKNRGKRKPPGADDVHAHAHVGAGEDDLHACQLTCGKLLSCGLHTCQRKDHKGACGRCLQASYDELICHCGETVIYPPVAW